jgi:phage tail sheath protein FI
MVELLAPGVYPIETSFRPSSIQGVGTSTTGFVGMMRNGPVEGPPRLVTSFGEFERLYGGLADYAMTGLGSAPARNYLALAVRGYFNEGGRRLYISRAYLPGGSDGFARAALVGANVADARHFILRSRFPGSGANGTVTISEIATPATDTTLGGSSVGTLARTRGTAALPARVTGVATPGAVGAGATLEIAVNGAAAQVITFNATQAVAQAAGTIPANVDVPAGVVLTASIDGLTQAAPIAAGAGRTRASIRDEISAALANGTCLLNGSNLAIRSNAAGSAVTVAVNQLALLGFTDPQTIAIGTGLPRLDAISANDLNGLLSTAGIAATANTVPGTGVLRISTQATGNAASLNLSAAGNVPALTALGFDPAALNAAVTGADGVARRVFIRETTVAAGWREYTEQPGGVWAAGGNTVDAAPVLSDNDHIVTLSLAWESVDGVSTSYEGLGFTTAHPRYFGHRMIGVADPIEEPLGDPLVLFTTGLNGAEAHAALFASGTANGEDVLSATIRLTGGNDGTLPALMTLTDALERLNLVDDIAIVAAPGITAYGALGDAVRNALIGHAQDSNFRIAVCDPPPGQELEALRRTRGQFDNTYAAFYAPWLRIFNPFFRPGNDAIPREIAVPPSGHICGIYARNDATRGVHKTPANEIIREAIGFERDYNQRHQEVLNPIGINVLRYLNGRGNRVYGGRLATSDREIVYVSDRRFLNFLKRSIYISMQWAVFEPNGPDLWSDVREAVASFLFSQWRNGALLGATPETSYFVHCDRTVITQDDLDNGRLICEVGVAIIKPAEFLVFRIGQTTADARS